MAQTGQALMTGNTPRGIRKRLMPPYRPAHQVRYLVRDPASASGWVETSAIFATLGKPRRSKPNETTKPHSNDIPNPPLCTRHLGGTCLT
jgi:integrase